MKMSKLLSDRAGELWFHSTGERMKRILHATDFGPQSAPAFAHALRITLDARAKLYLLHVAEPTDGAHWSEFPHVREVLGRWGLIDPGKPPQAIETELGIHVTKVSVHAKDARHAIAEFAVEHECDLLVVWTHDRQGASNWLYNRSVAGEIARRAGVQTLFLPGAAAGFVDAATGRADLECVLIPVDGELDCADALEKIANTLRIIAPGVPLLFLHVGESPPYLPHGIGRGGHQVLLRQGAITPTIVSVAREIGAGLIAMPTAGRHGLFDALRGSTTEQVLRESGLPVLAAPI